MRIREVRTHIFLRPEAKPGRLPASTPFSALEPRKEIAGTFPPGFPNAVYGLVEVTTDDGLQGWSPLGLFGPAALAAATLIEHQLGPMVRDRDPFDGERLWEEMFRATVLGAAAGIGVVALSAVDIALWDLRARALGVPVHRLLGGRVRERQPVYASRLFWPGDHDQLGAEAQAYARAGFSAVKLRFAWGPRHGRAGGRRNVEMARTVRAAVGDDVEVMCEAAQGWTVEYAVAVLRELEPFGLAFVEEPLMACDLAGYRLLRRRTGVPLAAGEHTFTRYGFAELLRCEAIDVVQPDVYRLGGLTEAVRVWAMAEAEGRRIVPHSGHDATYHLAITRTSTDLAEWFPDAEPPDGFWAWRRVLRGLPTVGDGAVDVDDTPGLGSEPDMQLIESLRAGWGAHA